MKTSNLLLIIFISIAVWFYGKYFRSVLSDWVPTPKTKVFQTFYQQDMNDRI